jgi:hypothetical protein
MRIETEALRAALHRVEVELERAAPHALSMIADHVVNEARRTTLFRDRTGMLRRSILRGPVAGSFASGTLAVDTKAGIGMSYGVFIHDGTRPHVIEAKRRKSLRFVVGGGFIFARSVRHPGTQPRPFMQEAVRASSAFATRTLSQAMQLAFARAGAA